MIVVFPVLAFILLLGGVFGLPHVAHRSVGRAAGDAGGRQRRHRRRLSRSASCWRSAAARSMPIVRWLSVGFIEFVRGVPLITVLFMASVMLPLFLPDRLDHRQAAARADRRGAVLGRLPGRGDPRRPAGDPARTVRGGRRARPHLLAEDGAHRPAAGAEAGDPRHRQHLHRPVQGHQPGADHRPVRPARHRAVRATPTPTGSRRRRR